MPRQVPRAPMLWIGVAAAALAGMLANARVRGAYDPAGQARMANYPGDLSHFLGMGAVELAVLVLILRPWSYRASVGRAILALVLFIPWALFNSVLCMHCGSIGGAHAGWLFLVAAGLFIAMIVSTAARLRARRTPS